MDLTKDYPRSPNDMLAGIVSLPRMIDKTQETPVTRRMRFERVQAGGVPGE